jgi:orotidine-5'-phosphate decarboxylase
MIGLLAGKVSDARDIVRPGLRYADYIQYQKVSRPVTQAQPINQQLETYATRLSP